MPSTALQLLRRLIEGLRAPASSERAALDLVNLAEEFEDASCALEGDLAESARVSLARATLECVEALSGLEAALLQGRLSLAGNAAAGVTGQNQLLAALITITGCSLVTAHLQPPRNDAFRVAKSFLQLAFGLGQAALAAAVEAVRAATPDRRAKAHVRKLLDSSILAVFSTGNLLPTSQNTSARPQQFEYPCYAMAAQAESWVPWLATVADAMLLCYTPTGGHVLPGADYLSLRFTFLVNALLGQERGRGSRAAIAPASAEVANVARALLLVCLPALAATAEARQGNVLLQQSGGGILSVSMRLGVILNSLSVPSVAQQAAACMQQPDAAEAALAAAASLARRVLEAAEGGGQDSPLDEVAIAPNLLGVLCGMHTFRFCYHIAPGGHGAYHQDGAPPSNATWELLAALPLLARFVKSRCMTDHCLASKAVTGLAAAMPFCGVSSFSSCEQVASWMAAAEPVLSLLQLLEAGQAVAGQEVAGQQQQQPEQGAGGSGAQLEQSVSILLRCMLSFMWDKTSEAVERWAVSEKMKRSGDQQREALAGLVQQLWGLHSACCRAMHWLTREPSRQRALNAHDLLEHAATLLFAALSVEEAAGGVQGAAPGDQSCVTPGALLAAHVCALTAMLASRRGHPFSPSSLCHLFTFNCDPFAGAVASDSRLWRLCLEAVLGMEDRAACREALTELVQVTLFRPEAALPLASAGLLEALLQTGGPASGMLEEFKEGADSLLNAIREPCCALIEMGHSDRVSGSPAAEVAPLKQQLDAALDEVVAKVEKGPASLEEASELAPQLRRLAELATQAWVLTGRAAESQLARARLAAARSCAYLGCANLAAEGGPGAGQGRGSKKCSGCRAVWYCGEACQLADWRQGGHRRVCKQLAAAAPGQAS